MRDLITRLIRFTDRFDQTKMWWTVAAIFGVVSVLIAIYGPVWFALAFMFLAGSSVALAETNRIVEALKTDVQWEKDQLVGVQYLVTTRSEALTEVQKTRDMALEFIRNEAAIIEVKDPLLARRWRMEADKIALRHVDEIMESHDV